MPRLGSVTGLQFPLASILGAGGLVLFIGILLAIGSGLPPEAAQVKAAHLNDAPGNTANGGQFAHSAAISSSRWIGLTPPSALKGPPSRLKRPKPSVPELRRVEARLEQPIESVAPLGPAIAIIIDDVGLDSAKTRAAMALPQQVTLSFLPYGISAPSLAREARAAGHEIMLHMPMEPLGPQSPGPDALKVGLSPNRLAERTQAALGRFDGLVGVNNHMGSRVTQDWPAMSGFMQAVAGTDLIFVDSRTSQRSVAGRVARRFDVPTADRDVFLDHGGGPPAAVVRALKQAEAVARRTGHALAIGHPRAETLSGIASWWPGARERGVRLVSITEYLVIQGGPDPIRVADVHADAAKAY